jgi:hypothetical protein
MVGTVVRLITTRIKDSGLMKTLSTAVGSTSALICSSLSILLGRWARLIDSLISIICIYRSTRLRASSCPPLQSLP